MASLRFGKRKDGSVYTLVLYRHEGRQCSTSFNDHDSAVRFQALIDQVGVTKALEVNGVDRTAIRGMTVAEWIAHYLDHLTGVDRNTITKYRAYLRNDIDNVLGAMPLTALSRDDIAMWVNAMETAGATGKTIKNKHGFLAGALNAAVTAGHIPANPCDSRRLPRTEQLEMVFLSRAQFALLLGKTTEYWRPLVEFLVASGCRWGEAAALQPGDVDRDESTVRITKAWKYGSGAYRVGPPKTRMSRRTIDVPASVLEKLDYSHEWLFVNRTGGPVRAHGFTGRVWAPAVERSWPTVDADGNAVTPELHPRIHDLRHTCASWMIAAGVPLPVIQRHLGHESIETTIGVYGHLDRTSSRAASAAMGEALGGP